MTIYWLNHKPHVAVYNGFKEISEYQAYELHEKYPIENVEVEMYD